MRTLTLALLFVGTLPVLLPRGAAAVNCDQVRRYLATGRSVQDVAETMIISVDEVKKCQQAGAASPAPAGTPEKKAQPQQ